MQTYRVIVTKLVYGDAQIQAESRDEANDKALSSEPSVFKWSDGIADFHVEEIVEVFPDDD